MKPTLAAGHNFLKVIDATPLVSIDLIVENEAGHTLLKLEATEETLFTTLAVESDDDDE